MPEKKPVGRCKINETPFLILEADPGNNFFLIKIELERPRDHKSLTIFEGDKLTHVSFGDYKFASLIVTMPPETDDKKSPKWWRIQCSEPKIKAEGGGR